MNVISAGPLYATLLAFVAAAVALVVVLGVVLRPKTRARYPGGTARYVLALIVQATAFILPIPFVAILLLGVAPAGLNYLGGFVAGFAALILLRFTPGIGPLLRDLDRSRLETAIERARPYSNAGKSS